MTDPYERLFFRAMARSDWRTCRVQRENRPWIERIETTFETWTCDGRIERTVRDAIERGRTRARIGTVTRPEDEMFDGYPQDPEWTFRKGFLTVKEKLQKRAYPFRVETERDPDAEGLIVWIAWDDLVPTIVQHPLVPRPGIGAYFEPNPERTARENANEPVTHAPEPNDTVRVGDETDTYALYAKARDDRRRRDPIATRHGSVRTALTNAWSDPATLGSRIADAIRAGRTQMELATFDPFERVDNDDAGNERPSSTNLNRLVFGTDAPNLDRLGYALDPETVDGMRAGIVPVYHRLQARLFPFALSAAFDESTGRMTVTVSWGARYVLFAHEPVRNPEPSTIEPPWTTTDDGNTHVRLRRSGPTVGTPKPEKQYGVDRRLSNDIEV